MPARFMSRIVQHRGRVAALSLIALAAMPVAHGVESSGISEQIDAVMSEAARTGMPVLALASTDSCEEAPRFRQRLVADPALQPLVARFAVVELRMSGDDKWTWKRWQERFDTHRRQSPQMFVIRADGRKMFSGDPPADVAGFLRRHLTASGQPIAARQADLYEAQLEAASRLQVAGDLAEAVRCVTPAARVPSYARPVVQSVAFRAAVADRLLRDIAQAGAEPAAGSDRLAVAEILVAAAEQYAATLPDVARAARERMAEIGREPEGRDTLRQAQLLHHAATAARRSAQRGLALYEQIIARHPDSAAAEIAAVRLRSLDGGQR